jgi:hypothetical protein
VTVSTILPTPDSDHQRLTRDSDVPAHLPAPAHWPGWAECLDQSDPPFFVRVIHDGAICRAEVVQAVTWTGGPAAPVTVHIDVPTDAQASDLPALADEMDGLVRALRQAHGLLCDGAS